MPFRRAVHLPWVDTEQSAGARLAVLYGICQVYDDNAVLAAVDKGVDVEKVQVVVGVFQIEQGNAVELVMVFVLFSSLRFQRFFGIMEATR